MSTKQFILLSFLYIFTGVVAAYIVYRLGWGGGGGGTTTNDPAPISPTGVVQFKPTGGYIPGRQTNNVTYN